MMALSPVKIIWECGAAESIGTRRLHESVDVRSMTTAGGDRRGLERRQMGLEGGPQIAY